jgi:hypothetical protein
VPAVVVVLAGVLQVQVVVVALEEAEGEVVAETIRAAAEVAEAVEEALAAGVLLVDGIAEVVEIIKIILPVEVVRVDVVAAEVETTMSLPVVVVPEDEVGVEEEEDETTITATTTTITIAVVVEAAKAKWSESLSKMSNCWTVPGWEILLPNKVSFGFRPVILSMFDCNIWNQRPTLLRIVNVIGRPRHESKNYKPWEAR